MVLKSAGTISVLILFSAVQVHCSVGDHLDRHLHWQQNHEHCPTTSLFSAATTGSGGKQQGGNHYTRDLLDRLNWSAKEEEGHTSIKADSFKWALLYGQKDEKRKSRAMNKKQEVPFLFNNKNARSHEDNCYVPYPFQQETDWWFDDPRYSSTIDCEFQAGALVCDYSAATPMLRGLCEAVGGTFYTLTGSMVCPSFVLPYTWNATKAPFCATNCDINDLIDEGYFAYPGCTNAVSDIVTYDSIISKTCKAEVSSFRSTAGNGNPQWVFENYNAPRECFSNFGSITTDGGGAIKELCDFKDAMDQMQGPCEEQGGVLYSYSEKIYHVQPFFHGYEMYRNIPVCLGLSCDAKPYFEEVLTSYLSYFKTDFDKLGTEIVIYIASFDLIEYKLQSKAIKPPSAAPSSEPPEQEKKFGKVVLRRKANGNLLIRTCNWLSKKSEKLKRKFCCNKKYQLYSEGYLPASRRCFTTCAPYCVKESLSAKFLLRSTIDPVSGKEVARTRQCKWLKKQDSGKINSICSTDVSAKITINTRYGQASEVCTETCTGSVNACSSSSITVPELPTIGPGCNVAFKGLLGDTLCDGRIYNTPECNYDQGDCLDFNVQYPSCNVPKPFSIGDGFCDGGVYNTVECGFDGGDCIGGYSNYSAPIASYLGDGYCLGGIYNSPECGYDLGDCHEFNEELPECKVLFPLLIGNGECTRFEVDYNTTECGYDGGDCQDPSSKYPNCTVEDPFQIGDNFCNGGDYNTPECGFDGGDCEEFNARYPDCKVQYPGNIGNYYCNGGDYNTPECRYDGGDCVEFNKYSNCTVEYPGWIGNNYCNAGDYNTLECGFDGGDCDEFNTKYPNCTVEYLSGVGNGYCNGGDFNTKECGYDGGDCDEFNAKYPDCKAEYPRFIGDGRCHIGYHYSNYNTEECGYDGGDCEEFENKYPNCTVEEPVKVGDGYCDGGEYNVPECDYDGGDCEDFRSKYPNCYVEDPQTVGDGYCRGGDFNTEECGFDGGDCDEFNKKYPNCDVEYPTDVGDGTCHSSRYYNLNTTECGYDGGDCEEFRNKYPNCYVDYTQYVGDGFCFGGDYNTPECGYDGGDCDEFNAKYPGCDATYPGGVGDGRCHAGYYNYNTSECGSMTEEIVLSLRTNIQIVLLLSLNILEITIVMVVTITP